MSSYTIRFFIDTSKLYDLDATPIERMAKATARFPGWQVPVFSYDADKVRYGIKISGSDIYMATGYSAQGAMEYIRALLKLMELDIETDFIYSARSNKAAKETTGE